MRITPLTSDGKSLGIDPKERYNYWNQKAFDGSLPDIPVKWSNAIRTGGTTRASVNNEGQVIPNSVRINISNLFAHNEDALDSILLHEMVHVKVFFSENPREGHGPIFTREREAASQKAGRSIPVTEDRAISIDPEAKIECGVVIMDGSKQLLRGKKGFQLYQGGKVFNNLLPKIKEHMDAHYSDARIRYVVSTNPLLQKFQAARVVKSGFMLLTDAEEADILADGKVIEERLPIEQGKTASTLSSAQAFESASDKVENIIKAMVNLNPIKITYRDRYGRMTRRILEPYKLCNKYGKNWLYAYCKMRDSAHIRMFKIERIKKLDNILDQTYSPRWDVEATDSYEGLAKEMASDMGLFEKKKKK